MRFYFLFLARRQEDIALGRTRYTLQEIQRHLIDFISTCTFEEWSRDPMGRDVVMKLMEKSRKVVPGDDRSVYYAFFARAEASSVDAILVDLARLDRDLAVGQVGNLSYLE